MDPITCTKKYFSAASVTSLFVVVIIGRKAMRFTSSAIQATNQEVADKISSRLPKRTQEGKNIFKR